MKLSFGERMIHSISASRVFFILPEFICVLLYNLNSSLCLSAGGLWGAGIPWRKGTGGGVNMEDNSTDVKNYSGNKNRLCVNVLIKMTRAKCAGDESASGELCKRALKDAGWLSFRFTLFCSNQPSSVQSSDLIDEMQREGLTTEATSPGLIIFNTFFTQH